MVKKPRFKSQLCPLVAVGAQTTCLASLSCSFLSSTLGIIERPQKRPSFNDAPRLFFIPQFVSDCLLPLLSSSTETWTP